MPRPVLSLVLVLAAVTAIAQAQPDRYREVADRLVAAYNAQDMTAMSKDFAPIVLKAFPEAKSKPFFAKLMAQLGKITKLGPGRPQPMFTVFPATFERGVLDIKLVLDGQGRICGLWFLPHTADIPAPKRNTKPLRLPFDGPWFVLWGGDTPEQNQHQGVPCQQHAIDFLIVDEKGKSSKGESRRNEDFYCFGKPVLAPADGVVTDVIRGVRDNRPQSMNPYCALGNAVFIRHGTHEVSVLAHFQLGSIRVKAGQKVKAGQVLGACGNSGNSSEPHLHYHLMNTRVMQDATGVKCFFQALRLIRDGKTATRTDYAPVKGDRVEAVAASAP